MEWQAQRTHDLPLSGMRQIFEAAGRLESQGHRVLHFELGRPDFDTPDHIKAAAKRALDEGRVTYTSNWGIAQLRQAIAAKMARENGIQPQADTDIAIMVGAIEGVMAGMLSTLDSGDEVLLPEPGWPQYQYCARLCDARPVSVPLREARGFRVDPEDVRTHITSKTRMIVVSTPHNPTGAVLDLETLQDLADIAVEHDLVVLADEIYEYLVYDGVAHHSIASLPGMWDRTLTVNGFSKAYAMTGWRLGYIVGPEHLINPAVRVRQFLTTCPNSFAQYGAVAAVEGPQTCVQEMVAEFDRRRRRLVEGLEAIQGIHCARPQGAFYVFPSIRDLGMSSAEFARYLLEDAHVALVPGSAFGDHGEGYVRIAYSTGFDDIEESLTRIEAAVGRLTH